MTRRGDIVLDPFLGSGATLMACERTGRRCYGLELDPLYCDVIIRRWQSYTGDSAPAGDDRRGLRRRLGWAERSRDERRGRAMSEGEDGEPDLEPSVANERVGYGRPPTTTRFRPGQSGNPRGRPKGARNLARSSPQL